MARERSLNACSYRFGPFTVDVARRLLLQEGQPVHLTSKTFDILNELIQHHGRVLDKNELMERVWPNQAVEEGNLTVTISGLRKALGERPGEHRYIVTVPGRGYQFVSPVSGDVQQSTTAATNRLWARPRSLTVVAAGLLLVTSVSIWLTVQRERKVERPLEALAVVPESKEAHREYVLGRFHWNRMNLDGWRTSAEHFNRALILNPDYAVAHAGLADAYVSLASDARPETESFELAKRSAIKAVQLDPSLAEAHVALARVQAYYDWDWIAAGRSFNRAIELSPNLADAHREYGLYLAVTGHSAQAVLETRRALEREPVNLFNNFAVGWSLIAGRRNDELIEHFQRSLDIDPNFVAAHHFIGLGHVGKRQYQQGISHIQRALSLAPDNLLVEANLGFAYAVSGNRSAARKILSRFDRLSASRYVSPYYVATIHAGLGNTDQAFASLEQAYNDKSRRLWALKVGPQWEALRTDARFVNLLHRLGLAE